jgi:hypothetical protein
MYQTQVRKRPGYGMFGRVSEYRSDGEAVKLRKATLQEVGYVGAELALSTLALSTALRIEDPGLR